MFDLSANVRLQHSQTPIEIKHQKKKKLKLNLLQIFTRQPDTLLSSADNADDNILHHLTSIALCHFHKK